MRTFAEDIQTARQHMRRATGHSHDVLDRVMTGFSLTEPRGYARFLSVQLAARLPIEAWCARYAPADLVPPPQSTLLRRDLAAMDIEFQPKAEPFTDGQDLEPLAIAWVIAGSSLGNRAILAQLTKSGSTLPTEFLADPRMIDFWKRLKPRLDRPVDAAMAERLSTSANLVFDHFRSIAEPDRLAA